MLQAPHRLAVLLLVLLPLAAVAEDAAAPLATRSFGPNRAGTVMGRRVCDVAGTEIGRVVDVLVDHAGRARAAVIDVGGFLGVGTRRVAMAWHLLHFSPETDDLRITVDLPPEAVAGAPEFHPPDNASIVIGRRPPPK